MARRRRTSPRSDREKKTGSSEASPARTARFSTATVTGIAGVVTIVSTLVGLVFVLVPRLKPDPPAVHTAAHLRQISFDRHVTFMQYLARSNQAADDLDARTLARRGVLLTFHFEIVGYKNQRLPLRWHLFEVRTGDQIGEEDSIAIEGTAIRDEGDWSVWVGAPRQPGRYAIVVQLINPSGRVPLATLETDSFRGERLRTEATG